MPKYQNKIRSLKKAKSSIDVKQTPYDYQRFKDKHAAKLKVIATVLFSLLVFCLFKNISYPLFWADESMTAMGSERVIQFGYPKIHDGKNVFYDLKHPDPKLGINEKEDAYVGGTGWGHYYYGVIGYKLAECFDDLYAKTGVYRASFAIIGLAGLLLLAFSISRFFKDKFSKYAFISLFLFFELISTSLLLLMREVRYYSLTLFLCSLIVGLYVTYRFYKPFNKVTYIIIFTIALLLLFSTFAPAYFILLLSTGLSETVIAVNGYLKKVALKETMIDFILSISPLLASLIFVYPLLGYFKTFEIAKAMATIAGFDNHMYWYNVSTVFKYFESFELFWLAVALKILILFHYKQIAAQKEPVCSVSNFLTLVFIVFVFSISRIPNFIFTRYIIYIQPLLCIIIILDFYWLLQTFSRNSKKLYNTKMLSLCVISLLLLLYPQINNAQYISGYIHQMTEPYKGPLDYTIPYIKEKYRESDKLIIATNYEETSYMYYLKSKVIIGYTGNNLKEDIKTQPHILSYRKIWGNYGDIFKDYMQKAKYEGIAFPVYDNPVNNIPELNFLPVFKHQFKTIHENKVEAAAVLFIRRN
jgi:hypothetical protein